MKISSTNSHKSIRKLHWSKKSSHQSKPVKLAYKKSTKLSNSIKLNKWTPLKCVKRSNKRYRISGFWPSIAFSAFISGSSRLKPFLKRKSSQSTFMMENLICKKSSMTFIKLLIPKSTRFTTFKKKSLILSSLIIPLKVRRSAMSPKIWSRESDSARLCLLKMKTKKSKPKELHLFKKWKFLPASKTNQCLQEEKHSQAKSSSNYQLNMVSLQITLRNFWKRAISENHSTHKWKWQNSKK